MAETTQVFDPFHGKTVEISDRLVDRLRGRYAVGPMLPSGEPEFGWRQHDVAPIQKIAADRIERLEKTLGEISRMRIMPDDKLNRVTLHAAIEIARMQLED